MVYPERQHARRRRQFAGRHRRAGGRARPHVSGPHRGVASHGGRGLGRSYVDGIRSALRAPGVDVICQMDSDLSHDPRQLRALIAASEHADVVIGSRYIPGGAIVNWPLPAAAAEPIREQLHSPGDTHERARLHQRLPLLAARSARVDPARSDRLGGLFLSRRDDLRGRRPRGLRFAEVPITFVERRLGESKLSKAVLIESAITPWRLIASRKVGRHRPPVSPFHAMV